MVSTLIPSGHKPVCFILVGIPGSGKTTWAENCSGVDLVLSSDKFVEQLCAEKGLTYSQGFDALIGKAYSMFVDSVDSAIAVKRSFVWDQTNLTEDKRSGILGRVKKDYYTVCVSFEEGNNVARNRRESRLGKVIPKRVINSMEMIYERPKREEGFDSIIVINRFLLPDGVQESPVGVQS